MSSIKDLLQEERDAESSLKEAEREAEAIVLAARTNARQLVRQAQSDDTLVKEMTQHYQEKITELRAKIHGECQTKVSELEKVYRGNLQVAIKLIVDQVLGVSG